MNKAVLIQTGWYTFRLPAKRYKRMCCIHQRVQQLLLFFLLFTISMFCNCSSYASFSATVCCIYATVLGRYVIIFIQGTPACSLASCASLTARSL